MFHQKATLDIEIAKENVETLYTTISQCIINAAVETIRQRTTWVS